MLDFLPSKKSRFRFEGLGAKSDSCQRGAVRGRDVFLIGFSLRKHEETRVLPCFFLLIVFFSMYFSRVVCGLCYISFCCISGDLLLSVLLKASIQGMCLLYMFFFFFFKWFFLANESLLAFAFWVFFPCLFTPSLSLS